MDSIILGTWTFIISCITAYFIEAFLCVTLFSTLHSNILRITHYLFRCSNQNSDTSLHMETLCTPVVCFEIHSSPQKKWIFNYTHLPTKIVIYITVKYCPQPHLPAARHGATLALYLCSPVTGAAKGPSLPKCCKCRYRLILLLGIGFL